MSREGPVADPCLILCGIAIADRPIYDICCKQEQLTWQIQQLFCSEDRTQERKKLQSLKHSFYYVSILYLGKVAVAFKYCKQGHCKSGAGCTFIQ